MGTFGGGAIAGTGKAMRSRGPVTVRGGGFGQFSGGPQFTPVYDYSEEVHPITGAKSQHARMSGGVTRQDPYSYAFGQSVQTMGNLGNTVGNAFGTVNAMNLASAEKQRDREYLRSLLGQMLGGFNASGQFGNNGFRVYGDYNSKATTGGYRP